MRGQITTIALLVACVAAHAGVVNGSFEKLGGQHFQHGTYGDYTLVPGWFAETYGSGRHLSYNPIEIGTGATYGVTGYDGKNVLELDSTGNSKVSQFVSGLNRDKKYEFSFDFARRAGTTAATNAFEVLWNDKVIDTITPTSTAMSLFTFDVVGRGEDKLSFEAIGKSDSVGGIIDDVSVKALGNPDGPHGPSTVPEPCSMTLVAASVAAWVRRRRLSRG